MFRPLVLLALVPLLATPAAAGEDQMPETLVVGYDEEGKVDASDAACRAFVAAMVDWGKPEVDQAVVDVCAVRKRHVESYAALQDAYKAFRAELADNVRLDGASAAKHLSLMIKACIDHKWGLTTGGHNIRLDMIPNAVDADCLDIGRDLIVKETAVLKGG